MAARPDGAIRKRSVMIEGHATSVSLEPAFWDALTELARARGTAINQLIAEIDRSRSGNLSSAIRVFVLRAAQGIADDGSGAPPTT